MAKSPFIQPGFDISVTQTHGLLLGCFPHFAAEGQWATLCTRTQFSGLIQELVVALNINGDAVCRRVDDVGML